MEVCYPAIKNYYTTHVQTGAVKEGKERKKGRRKKRRREKEKERDLINTKGTPVPSSSTQDNSPSE